MLLAIDIGNTNIILGVFEDKELRATWRIATGIHRLADEYAVLLLNLLRQQGTRADPQVAVPVLEQGGHVVVSEPVARGQVLQSSAVVPKQAARGADPQDALTVPQDTPDPLSE